MDWGWEMALERVAVSREASISRPALSRILGLTPAQPPLRDWDGAALGNTLAPLGGGGEGRNMQSRAGCAIWLPRLGRGSGRRLLGQRQIARRQHYVTIAHTMQEMDFDRGKQLVACTQPTEPTAGSAGVAVRRERRGFGPVCC